MSIKDCLRRALDAGEISKEEFENLTQRYDALLKQVFSKGAAKEALAKEIEAEALEKKRRALLTEQARRAVEPEIMSHRDRDGRQNPGEAFLFLHEHFGQARFADIENNRLAILGQAHAKMEGLLHEGRKGAVTGDLRRWRPKVAAKMDNIVRELFGEDSGDAAAKRMAQAWTDVAEDLRVRFNAAGGAIGKLQKWGLPQYHNPEALLAVGREAWINRILPMLDPAKSRHPLTGMAMTADELAVSLRVIYDRITTDGWSEREATMQPYGKGALFRQHADHRFLHFKDAASWLQYARDFGEGDPFAAMMAHLGTMARDIAAMEKLGPNPEAMRNYLKQLVQKHAMTSADETVKRRAETFTYRADEMWSAMRGTLNTPVNSRIANVFDTTRALVTAASLGSAALSAVSDVAFGKITRRMAGLPASTLGTLSGVVSLFRGANAREAVRAGLILDSAVHALHRQARYVGSLSSRTWAGYLSDRVMALQGLSAWTQAGKHAFGMAFQAELADRVTLPLDQMPDALQRTLQRHGITAAEWDKIRASALYEPEPGAVFLRPTEIQRTAGGALAEKYLAMILRETRYAVPEPTLRSSTILKGGARPGTLVGELARSTAQFKSFGVAVVMLHGDRIARETARNGRAAGARYAGALLITGTIFGALALQLKEIAQGRDPRDMRSPNFWGAAALQSGGLGIYGDFLFAGVNRFGGGLADTVAGPVWGRLGQARDLTIGNAEQAGMGEPTNAGRETVRFLRQNTPGGSIWWLRAAYERTVLDQLQELADPQAHAAFRRQMQNRQRNYGNGFWWQPGEAGPRRGPDFSGAFGR